MPKIHKKHDNLATFPGTVATDSLKIAGFIGQAGQTLDIYK